MDQDFIVLSAARAARTENQDAIDAAIVGMLSDPKEVLSQSFEIDLNIFDKVKDFSFEEHHVNQ